jgi:hypothetical protein
MAFGVIGVMGGFAAAFGLTSVMVLVSLPVLQFT